MFLYLQCKILFNLYSMKLSYFILVLILCASSCSKQKDETAIEYGYNYFPIDTAKNYVYTIDSISYNSNTKTVDTFKFILKTKFEESFIDTNGNKIWRLKRFAKYKNTIEFIETQNHFVQFSNNQYIYTENNLAYLKAIFPLKNNLNWNGNLYNSLIRIKSEINFYNQDFLINDTTFLKSTKINEEISEDFIFDIERFSVYQNNIGLVYFKNKNIETQTNQQGQPVKSGFDVRMRLIEIID